MNRIMSGYSNVVDKVKNRTGLTTIKLHAIGAAIIVVSVTGIFIGYARTSSIASIEKTQSKSNSISSAKSADKKVAGSQSQNPNTVASTQKPAPGATTSSPSTKTPAATTQPAPTLPPATATVTTDPNSCLPSDASVYDKYYIHMNSSTYLNGNRYANTVKFSNAINFAGLQSIVDAKKTVVFAIDDYAFNQLSASQLAFMNASPANMKSILGWHVITSCVIWHHNMNAVKSPITLNTLNGAVTYYPGSPGKINNTSMAIWDWYTSNGAVHIISGFIAPPSP